MSGNRSLDDFAEAGQGDAEPVDDEETMDGEGPEDDAEPADEADGAVVADVAADASPESSEPGNPPAPDATDRPASTYAWDPEGAPCAACGTAVQERWRDGDDLVCAGCKEW